MAGVCGGWDGARGVREGASAGGILKKRSLISLNFWVCCRSGDGGSYVSSVIGIVARKAWRAASGVTNCNRPYQHPVPVPSRRVVSMS
jgi:hypothetical protein